MAFDTAQATMMIAATRKEEAAAWAIDRIRVSPTQSSGACVTSVCVASSCEAPPTPAFTLSGRSTPKRFSAVAWRAICCYPPRIKVILFQNKIER
eukprot:scaffold42830_cov176-Amphora_coffeaeformis.AAC.4